MERVNNGRILIGFSCGNQFIMTSFIAFKVYSFKYFVNENALQIIIS